VLAFNNVYASTNDAAVPPLKIPTYMITTRNNQDYPQGVPGSGYNNYRLFDIRQLLQSCPPEAVFFVHGWGIDVNKAQERLDKVKMSLEHNKYNISLIGFSWDSNRDWEPAKSIAKQKGAKLTQFILDYMHLCKYEH
jgi:hypothetical protein